LRERKRATDERACADFVGAAGFGCRHCAVAGSSSNGFGMPRLAPSQGVPHAMRAQVARFDPRQRISDRPAR
jgi:hypothetical protein